MNVSHAWLREFVPHALSPDALRDLLTAHVATVEGMARTRAELEPFVVGRVVESERIPETRLSFNKVDDGSGTLLEVVCGAPNVTVGAKYPFARTGTTMPSGLLIERRKIRGHTSNGMLCSPRELGLGDDHDGILELSTDAAPGTPLLDVLPLSDVRLTLDVLPNRPDLLSHRGVAREVAALTGAQLRTPAELGVVAPLAAAPASGGGRAGTVAVRVDAPVDCGRYVAVIVRGLAVGPSPDWLRARVESVGGRSINNVVDATNYVLHGFGQPVHAFDLAKLAGPAIVVRRAKATERLVTLDGVDRALSPDVLVIADAERPVAVAGVMGGRDSEVTATTTDVLLEIAAFAPRLVRAGRRQLGLSTDASYRFERGIDENAVAEVAAAATALVVSVAGGRVDGATDVRTPPAAPTAIMLDPERVSRLLGDAVPAAESEQLLRTVGFDVSRDGGRLRVVAPTWRHDVSRDVDLVEEVARLRGYDRLPDALTSARPGTVPDHPLYVIGQRVRDALVARGLLETRPLPYAKEVDGAVLRVRNPIGEDEPFLRARLLHTLARRAEHNLARMQGDIRLFEVGTAFLRAANGAVREEVRVGALLMGARRPAHFTEPDPPAFDAWDAKALAEAIAAAAWPGARVSLAPADDALWTVVVDGAARGSVAIIALDAPVWASAAFGVEITLGVMPTAPVAVRGRHDYAQGESARDRAPTHARYAPLPTQPAAEVDLALIVPDSVTAAAVEDVLRRVGGALLESVMLFDEYRGAGVPDGSRSLAWRLTFRHPERTLRDKEIEGRRAQLLKSLEQEIGVHARSG